MKFAITSKGDSKSNALMHRMRTSLQEFNLENDEDQPDIVISIGGDGTLLYAFHRYKNRLDKTAFVGVHTGHLGFYADWTPEEIDKLVNALANTPFQVVEYPLLEVIVRYQHDGRESRFLALNESTVKSVEGTLVMDVEMRGEHFETLGEMGFVYQLHQVVRHIIKLWVVRLFIRQFRRFNLQKWLRLITEYFGRLDRR